MDPHDLVELEPRAEWRRSDVENPETWSETLDAVELDPVPRGGAAVHFFIFQSGKIVELDGLQHLEANPTTVEYHCNYDRGDTVPPLVDNGGRSGYVIVHEKTPQEAIDRARQLARGVVARTG